ncbi:MAG: murein biosynthesis integral membrane protein MurJ [Opitutaceae bacterium]|nr:murein biosynthesis integral membrane protein MurJ [Opitutaceae bacterium]
MSKNLERIGLVAGSTVVSRILGLIRDILTTAVFGVSALNSAFVTAFTFPNLFRRLLGEGALTAAVIPTVSDELDSSGKEGAFSLLNKVFSWLLLVTVVLVFLAMLAIWGVKAYPGLEHRWYLGAELTQILFPYVVFICLAAAFAAVLNVLSCFVIPALSAVWLNSSIILFLGGFGLWLGESAHEKMYWLCAGVLVGGFFQCMVPALALYKRGWRVRFDLKPSDRLKEIGRLMLPGLFGAAIFQINILTSRALAFALDEASATLLYLANRLIEMPLGIFAIAISTVVFPLLTKQAGKKDFKGMGVSYRKGLSLILIISIPAALGLIILGEPIVRLLFERGAFSSGNTTQVVPVLTIFALGMPFYAFAVLVTKGFYSLKDTATPARVAGVGFILNLTLSLILMSLYGTVGLAAASNLSIVFQLVLLQSLLSRREPNLEVVSLWGQVVRIAVATLVMSLFIWSGREFVLSQDWSGLISSWVSVGCLIPLGLLIYVAVLWGLKIEGRDVALETMRRFFRSRFKGKK